MVPENAQGYKVWIQTTEKLTRQVQQIIDRHNEETELSHILINITKRNLGPRTRKGDADG
jgi:hypothetical protein